MRAFVAIEIPPDVLQILGKTIQKLAALKLDGRPARLQSIHLTLKFLGNVDPERLDSVKEALRASAAGLSPFELRVRSVGVFPDLSRPRVVWFGVGRPPSPNPRSSGSDPLTELQRSVEDGLQPLGFEPERRSFRPHLTLMRLKSGRNLPRLVQYLKDEGLHAEAGSFRVDSLHLYRSILRPDGAEYVKLASMPLGGA